MEIAVESSYMFNVDVAKPIKRKYVCYKFHYSIIPMQVADIEDTVRYCIL
jgi:hypothetical protein